MNGQQSITLRDARPDDHEFLREMSLEAMLWREDAARPAVDELLAIPEVARYFSEWGRQGDTAVIVASGSGERLGAAWFRFFSAAEPGYGFVAEEIPELGIALSKRSRGQGLGRMLMQALIERARRMGLRGLSLSVEDGNSRAARLYTGLGFTRVQRVGTAWTMLLELT